LAALEVVSGRVELNLGGVGRFNSVGARLWMDGLRRLTRSAQVVCVECSVPVILQLDMVVGFLCHASVRSFYAPMRCERCDIGARHLRRTDDVRDADLIEPPRCSRCGPPMELDEPEDAYLLFLREPTLVRRTT